MSANALGVSSDCPTLVLRWPYDGALALCVRRCPTRSSYGCSNNSYERRRIFRRCVLRCRRERRPQHKRAHRCVNGFGRETLISYVCDYGLVPAKKASSKHELYCALEQLRRETLKHDAVRITALTMLLRVSGTWPTFVLSFAFGLQRLSYEFHTMVLRRSYAFPVDFLRVSSDSLRSPYKCPMVLCASDYCVTMCIRLSYNCHLMVGQSAYAVPTTVLRLSYDCPTIVRQLSYDCPAVCLWFCPMSCLRLPDNCPTMPLGFASDAPTLGLRCSSG